MTQVNASSTSIDLTWSVPIGLFHFYKLYVNNVTYNDTYPLLTDLGSNNSVAVNGLSPNMNYSLRMTSVSNLDYESQLSVEGFVATAPGKPLNVLIRENDLTRSNSLIVTWQPPENGADYYNVMLHQDMVIDASGLLQNTSHQFDGLVPGQTYTAEVHALNWKYTYGESAMSNKGGTGMNTFGYYNSK